MRYTKKLNGFTLLELLMVVILIAILAISIITLFPNMTDSTKQSATVANIRSIASAMSIYHMDNNQYPEAQDIDTLRSILEPVYIKRLPVFDGWGQVLFVHSEITGYTIGSGGKGWNGQEALTSNPAGPTSSYESDIILSNGSFTQYPAQSQFD